MAMTKRRRRERPDGPRPVRSSGTIAWVFLATTLTLTLYHAVSGAGGVAIYLLLSIATFIALLVGPRLHRPSQRRTWRLLAVAVVFWVLGAALRGDQVGRAPLLSDLMTLPAYLLVVVAYVDLLRHRRVVRTGGALLDGLVLGTSTAVFTWRFMIEPLLGGVEISPQHLVFSLVYPVIDTVLLLILAQLSFTDASRTPSYWLFATSISGLLVGDLFWNAAATGRDVALAAVTIPYFVAYAALGASALHPSMRRLTSAQRAREALPLPRVAILAVALAGPTVLTALSPGESLVSHVIIAVAAIGLSTLVLLRTARATNAFALAADRFEHSATHDELTGLPNRRLLMQELRDHVDPDGPSDQATVVLFLDLDAFKLINDAWGHEAGDELLIQVALRLRSTIGSEGMVARIGGDEFVVLVSRQVPVSGAQGLAEELGARLLDAFASSFQISPGEVFVTPAVGASWHVVEPTGGRSGRDDESEPDLDTLEALVLSSGADPDQRVEDDTTDRAAGLLRDADTAMYEAKSSGRGRFAPFDLRLRQRVRYRLELENALRKALENDELTLAYQPLIDLGTRQLVGWEALARWHRPGLGPVSPADFIPVAEHTGLIVPLGRWAMRESLSQLHAWRTMLTDQGFGDRASHLYMSVNVSMRQLCDISLDGLVREELARNDLPAASLCVEITESALLDDALDCITMINRLRDMGISLAVDDFGTGYSALGYLKRYPFNIVKIDKLFVAGLETSPDDSAIVRAVVAMAGALGLRLVAEGIETDGQARLLHELGCGIGQGYLLGRPAPAAAATEELIARATAWLGVAEPVA